VVCVDTSGSMQSSDVSPTRAQAAIDALHRFVKALGPQVRIGIVSFSTQAQADIQPTTDRGALADAIDTIPKPNGATAIGDALNLAGQMLPSSGRRAIILLTDGVNNRGSDPLEISHDLANHHIPVYTIGIGTQNSGQIIPGSDEEASTDPAALKQYSDITGGTSVIAADASSIIGAFATLATSSIWEVQRIDASIISAMLGGLCMTATILLGSGLGKFP
jgi:Ca-activated chloride channel family protein